MKFGLFFFILIFISYYFYLNSINGVLAFEASSTSFEIHAGAIDSIAGTSTSANFQNTGAGGQLATGTSTISGGTARKLFSGILYWLHGIFSPRYDQIHFRWRNDDGSESLATWAANEDIQLINLSKGTVKRLRFEVSNEGWRAGNSQQFRIEYASTTTCSSGTYTAVPATAATEHWQMASSGYVNDGEATTNVSGGLTDENANFVAGQVKTTGNPAAAIILTSSDFTEIEYGIVATSTANNSGTYCFRLTNNGSTANFNYSQYAKVVLGGGGYPATGELTSMIFDTGTEGAAYNSVMWKGTLGAGGSGKVRFQLATSNSAGGPWNFIGGATCGVSDWYDPGGPDTPIETTCAPQYHNNQRYFRYKVQICSNDCSVGGNYTPTVEDAVVSWSP